MLTMPPLPAPLPGLTSEVARFRHFNRMYTRYIGTLNEGLLNSDYSLAEARVLYELATRTAPKASEIAEELGMDAGYLSRLLGKFERDGLLTRKTVGTGRPLRGTDAHDARQVRFQEAECAFRRTGAGSVGASHPRPVWSSFIACDQSRASS
jgi:hypothetical protein